jgi:hypothetical protein
MYVSDTPIANARRALIAILALVLFAFLAACATSPTVPGAIGSRAEAASRAMTVYRSPDCSCCHVWADIARADGWSVATADVLDMTTFKAEHGVPAAAVSCHTAIIDGYVVEGHVPFAAIERLLTERPDIDGIALPGMPAGSPGMGGIADGPFEVLGFVDGETFAFGSY